MSMSDVDDIIKDMERLQRAHEGVNLACRGWGVTREEIATAHRVDERLSRRMMDLVAMLDESEEFEPTPEHRHRAAEAELEDVREPSLSAPMLESFRDLIIEQVNEVAWMQAYNYVTLKDSGAPARDLDATYGKVLGAIFVLDRIAYALDWVMLSPEKNLASLRA